MVGDLWQSGIESQKFSASREGLFLGSVSQKAEMADAHKAVGQHMEEEAADKLLGVKGQRLFSIPVFSVPVGEGNFSVLDFEDTVI